MTMIGEIPKNLKKTSHARRASERPEAGDHHMFNDLILKKIVNSQIL